MNTKISVCNTSNKERWNGKNITMKQERDFCFALHKRLSKHCRVLINSSLTIYSLNPEQLKWFHGALTWDVWKCHIPGRQVYVTLLNSTVAQHLESPDGYIPPAPSRSLRNLNGNIRLWLCETQLAIASYYRPPYCSEAWTPDFSEEI